jgi:hypothetical protein
MPFNMHYKTSEFDPRPCDEPSFQGLSWRWMTEEWFYYNSQCTTPSNVVGRELTDAHLNWDLKTLEAKA